MSALGGGSDRKDCLAGSYADHLLVLVDGLLTSRTQFRVSLFPSLSGANLVNLNNT
jgi:hypothetical protein